ncbi:MAG: VanZ family protein [Bacteroidota bacterium]
MRFSLSKQMLFVGAAVLFFLFIIYIIICADLGQAGFLAGRVRNLPFGDKMGHFLLYGMLAFLVNLAFSNARWRLAGWLVLKGSTLVVLFAVAEELTQIFLANRSFELVDILCDLLGIYVFGKLARWIL